MNRKNVLEQVMGIDKEYTSKEERFAFEARVSRDKMLAALSAGAIGLSFTLSARSLLLGIGKIFLCAAWIVFTLNLIFVLINYHYISKIHESRAPSRRRSSETENKINKMKLIVKWFSSLSFMLFFLGLFLFAIVSYLYLFEY